ncbi:hypothetical protein U3516DRAFT_764690 [Neocallimastix sp. 'constans']
MVVYSVKEYSGITPIAPGAEISKQGEVEEMIDAQIRNVIKGYAFAGYDVIEIHGTNNYLLQQFYYTYMQI